MCKKKYDQDLHLKKTYGISNQDFEAMKRDQQNRCKSCGNPFDIRPEPDHDHATGGVRGLLCHGCNSIVGFCHENPETLYKVADYIREHCKKL